MKTLGFLSRWTAHVQLLLPFLTGTGDWSLVHKAAKHVCRTLDDTKQRKARKRKAEERAIQTLLDTLTDQVKRRITLRRNTTTTTMTMTDILHNLPDMSASQVDRLLTLCQRRGLYDCLVVASLRYGRLGETLHFTATEADFSALLYYRYRLPVVLNHLLRGDLLDILVDDKVWPSWERVLFSLPELSRRALVLWLSRIHLNREGLNLFRMLLDASPRHWTFVRSQLNRMCLIPQYRTLLMSKMTYTRWCQEYTRPSSEQSAFSQLKNMTVHRYRIGDYRMRALNKSLIVLCETGLLTDTDDLTAEYRRRFSEAMCDAVIANQPDIVKFLYSTGSISNATVFQLSRDWRLIAKYHSILTDDDDDDGSLASLQEDPDPEPHDSDDPASLVPPLRDDPRAAAQEIRCFLESRASEPRSLKSLCLGQVARGLGWGYAKMAALDRLRDEIPNTLVEDLFAGCDRHLLNCDAIRR